MKRLEAAFVILIFYLSCLIIGDRVFSYLSINVIGLPLYVAEIFLAILLLLSFGKGMMDAKTRIEKIELAAWAIFYLCALQSVLRGFRDQPALSVLRDSAIVYYSLFYFLAKRLVTTHKRLFILGLATGTAVILKTPFSVIQLLGKVIIPIQPAAASMYISLFILCIWITGPALNRYVWIVLTVFSGFLGMLLMLLQVRTSWVGITIAGFAFLIFGYRAYRQRHFSFLVCNVILALGFMCIWNKAVSPEQVVTSMGDMATFKEIVAQPRAVINELTNNTSETRALPEAEKPLIQTQPSLSTDRTRLWMWGDMFSELAQDHKWLVGIPFGQLWLPPRLIPWWDMKLTKRIDPHNSMMAILYRLGVFGLIALFFIVATVYYRAKLTITHLAAQSREILVLYALLAMMVYCLMHSLTDVTLENPFKGVFFWVALGLLSAFSRVNDESR